MSTRTRPQELLTAPLDEIYKELISEAQRLAEAYLEEASSVDGGGKKQVKLLIQVKQHTPQSWGIYWARNTAAPGTPANPMTINKGEGTKYPLSTFSRVKEPLKTICRTYEKRLALIRSACIQNRTLRRSLEAHGRLVAQAVRSAE